MPSKKVKEAYAAIKKLTGLKFDETDQRDVERALGMIYVDGKNLLRKNRPARIEDGVVVMVANELKRAFSCQNNSFVALMKPNDMTSTPQILSVDRAYDDAGKEVSATREIKQRIAEKNRRAKEYAKRFAAEHRQKLNDLYQDLKDNIFEEKMRVEDYFPPEYLETGEYGTTFKSHTGRVEELPTRTSEAAQFCNNVLMGRGYTTDEIFANGAEVQEAKRKVGAELCALMFDEMPREEFSTRFRALCEDSLEGIRTMTFLPVDFADESTFDNARYNRMLGTQAAAMGQMIQRQSEREETPWAREMWAEVEPLQLYTQMLGQFERNRLLPPKEPAKEELADASLGQALVDKGGLAWNYYSTANVKDVRGREDLVTKLFLYEMAMMEQSEEWEDLLDAYGDTGDLTAAREAAERFIQANPEGFAELLQPALAFNREEKIQWLAFGESAGEVQREMRKVFGDVGTSQFDRGPTIKALFLGYVCRKLEQEGKEVDLEELLHADAKTQQDYGKEAFAFFRSHPIPAATIEEQRENVRLYDQCNAALNRGLRTLQLPQLPEPGKDLTMEQRKELEDKTGLLTDVFQLNSVAFEPGLISREEARSLFYEAYGGKEAYDKLHYQNTIAGAALEGLTKAGDIHRMRRFKPKMLTEEGELLKGIVSVAYQSGLGKDSYGKRIGELSDNEEQAKRATCATEYLQSSFMPYLQEMLEEKPEEKPKELVSEKSKKLDSLLKFVESRGSIDEIGIREQLNGLLNKALQVSAEESEREAERDQKNEERYERQREEARTAANNWFGELSDDAWKEKLTRMYEDLDSHDPALLRSSKEYKNLKAGLQEAIDAVGDRQSFNAAMDKIFSNAGQYLENKKTGSLGKHYGQARWTAVCNLRDELAAGGKKKYCSAENLVDYFAVTGTTPEEKRADALSRMGEYLKTEEHRALFTRVLEENGKNAETRNKLREEMKALTVPKRDIESAATAMRDDLKEMIMPKKTERKLTDYSDFCRAMKTLGGESFKGAPLGTAARLGDLMKKTDSLKRDIYYGKRKDALTQNEAGLMAVRAAVDGMAKLDNTKTTLYLMKGNTLKQLSDAFSQSALGQDIQKQTPEQLKQTFFTNKGQMVNSVAAMKQAKDILVSKGGQSVKQPTKTKTKAKTQEKKAAARGSK